MHNLLHNINKSVSHDAPTSANSMLDKGEHSMNIYDPLGEALGLTPFSFPYNIKEKMNEIVVIENNSHKSMFGEFNPMKKIRRNNGTYVKGQKPIITPERNDKIRKSKLGEKNHNYGNKNAANHMNVNMTCEHCFKIMTKGNYYRWHGIKCRSIS